MNFNISFLLTLTGFLLSNLVFSTTTNSTEHFRFLPLKAYSCTQRLTKVDLGTYDFLLTQDLPIEPIAHDDLVWTCHDENTYGRLDNIFFPRFNERTTFSLWGEDVEYSSFFRYFSQLIYKAAPKSTLKPMGYVLNHLLSTNNKYTCLTRNNAAELGADELFLKVLVNTQPLYVAKREGLSTVMGKAMPDNYLILSKEELEPYWFYFRDGAIHPGGSNDYKNRTMFFAWPFSETAPFEKNQQQHLYQIVFASDVAELKLPNSQIYTDDKSFACVPKL